MHKQRQARLFSYFVILSLLLGLLGAPVVDVNAAATITFTAEELLGKPEDTSIAVNIVPASTIQYHYQFGTISGTYTGQTDNVTATGGQPSEVLISGLNPNTQYFYRMQYHAPGDAMDDWVNRTEHSFWTQRAPGSSFSFSVTSDDHHSLNTATTAAMTNILNAHADFEIDLGDTFYTDTYTSQSGTNTRYLDYRAQTGFGKIGGSVPVFLSSGNHEDEEGWNLDDTPFSTALASIQARKLYYPTPIDDGFYSGNTDILAAINAATYGDQFREDYYAWTWGDALFVVIDPFQYTMTLPYTGGPGEPTTGETVNTDQWGWTLGKQQFQWLRQTLENSAAKYKFVFSHQVVGGITRAVAGVGAGYVRGGAENMANFEWGDVAGFATHRNAADFGTTPIHQLFVANGVSAYFHGHDHQYVYEKTDDGVVYQEVPSPGMGGSGFSGIYSMGDHGTYQTLGMYNSTGHLLVSVNPTSATVKYISSVAATNGNVITSYTIDPHVNVPRDLTIGVNDPAGGTVSPSLGTHTYNQGNIVPISATANPGYFFSGWSGDVGTVADVDDDTTTITMNADYDIIANFSDLSIITPTPSNTPTATQTRTSTPTPTATRTPTNTRTATNTFTPSRTRTNTPTPTGTRTVSATPTSTRTATATFTPSNTPTATFTPSSTPSRTATATFTPTYTLTGTSTATFTPTDTPTFTPSNTPTNTATATFTPSNTPTKTFTVTFTPSLTPSNTPTRTNTFTATFTPSMTSSTTPTRTNTFTATFTPSLTSSTTPTRTSTFTATFTPSLTSSNTPTRTNTFTATFTPSNTPTRTNTPTATSTSTRTSTPTATLPPTNTYDLPLLAGWNLVSFNLHPLSTLTADVLNTVAGKYSLVYAWNAASAAWLKYDPSMPPELNSLKNLDETMGFWVRVNSGGGTLTVSGSLPGTSHIALGTGWNLVGFPASASLPLPAAFSAHGLDDFSLVYAYHASDTADLWKKFDPLVLPVSLNDLTALAPGWGYWVDVDTAAAWDVSY